MAVSSKTPKNLHSLSIFLSSPNPNPNPRPDSEKPNRIPQTLSVTGPTTLSGHVSISGSKNSSLSLLAATLLCSNSSLLHNEPTSLTDIRSMLSILNSLGVTTQVNIRNNKVLVDTDSLRSIEPCLEEMKKIRGCFFVIGPLLARFGEAVVGLPGGRDIGERPVLTCTFVLGAVVEFRDGKVLAEAANGRGLIGGSFHLDYRSVGATQTLMMAASMADGVTVLSNVAKWSLCVWSRQ